MNREGRGLGFSAAIAAMVTNRDLLASPARPGTPLRALAVIALTGAMAARGIAPDTRRRNALLATMELGAALNDLLDGDEPDRLKVTRHMARFRGSPHCRRIRHYVRAVMRLERGRPGFPGKAETVGSYREQVNLVSLAALWAVASDSNLPDAADAIRRERDLGLLFRLVMQCQMIDDAWDLPKDRGRLLPSLATAEDATAGSLRDRVSHYSRNPRLDRDGCLGLVARITAAVARLVIGYRALRGDLRPGNGSV